MLIRRPADLLPSEITTPQQFASRRDFIRRSGLGLAGAAALWPGLSSQALAAPASGKLTTVASALSTTEPLTARDAVTGYNNFYEFGTDKRDPAANAHRLNTDAWTLKVEGLVGKPRQFDVDELFKLAPLEERIYRLRCVEAWSMVVPWVGFPLASLLKLVEPLGSARYVEFVSHHDQQIMPYLPFLSWPYREGLRLDEALHPLTLMAVGVYGEVLPKQNGAPIRLVVPWKYGFKSAKSITTIRVLEQQPGTSWNRSAPGEYGFYANVNPDVSHPRWSQARERRIGDLQKRPTLAFNGYAEQVASLYQGMDLRKHY
ncbi:MAG: protein-methionine-sulfoxide reductase catalytic subunit MsrP [Thauera sp.]|jgi:sulfoxide reductase catalytic subunit YedY|nr:protein-methionine-sulfoxide reductase catalytic subunit MsrP [Thauera sp.]